MLENLKTLKDNMVEKHWTICSFLFLYKKINYIVLVKRFVGKDCIRRSKKDAGALKGGHSAS